MCGHSIEHRTGTARAPILLDQIDLLTRVAVRDQFRVHPRSSMSVVSIRVSKISPGNHGAACRVLLGCTVCRISGMAGTPELFTVAAMGRQAEIDRRDQYRTGASHDLCIDYGTSAC